MLKIKGIHQAGIVSRNIMRRVAFLRYESALSDRCRALELVHMSRLATIAVGMSFFFASSAAIACQCARLSVSARIDHADLVLVATVSSFEALDHVTVQPLEVFKGSSAKALTIQTGRSDCDFFLPPVNPTVGEEYLLYLQQSEGRWIASRCLASGLVEEKAAELQELRARFKSYVLNRLFRPGVREPHDVENRRAAGT
jgi:hypothetical protein